MTSGNSIPSTASMKVCSTCRLSLPRTAFNRHVRMKDGLKNYCRACQRMYGKVYDAKHKEQKSRTKKLWYQNNRERILAQNVEWQKKHPERVRELRRRRYLQNIERSRMQTRQWAQRNPERLRFLRKQERLRNPSIHREGFKRWAAKNGAYNRERRRIYQALHPETQRAWQRANREKIRTYGKRWRKAHPDKVRAIKAHYYARKKNAPRNDLTDGQWQAILAAYKFRCAYCGKKLTSPTKDHITPYAHQGAHTLHNIVPACRSCNSKKGTRAPLCAVQPLLLVAKEFY